MTVKDRAYLALLELNGRATERQLVDKYIQIYPDYDKNYTNTKTSSKAKIRGTINAELRRNSLHEKIKVDETKQPLEYYIYEQCICINSSEHYLNDEQADAELQNSLNDIQSVSPERKPQIAKTAKEQKGYKLFPRNLAYAKYALEKVDYLCEIDNNHTTFTSNSSKKQYVEAHHLIPLKVQDEFSYSLDVPVNIISLCPNCHRKIHFGCKQEKKSIIKELLDRRKDELFVFGIKVSCTELYTIYNI